MEIFAAVAQLDRVLGYEPRGRGFDSCQPRQNTVKGRLRTSFFASKSKLLQIPCKKTRRSGSFLQYRSTCKNQMTP